MTQMASDLFIGINNRRGLWYFDETEPFSYKPPQSYAVALPYDCANDLFGVAELDEHIQPTVILPKQTDSNRPSNIDSYMKSHQNDIEVLYECPCIADNKIRHHPDYSKLWQVALLCRKCHAVEHAKINRDNNQLLINMIAIKMFFNLRHALAATSAAYPAEGSVLVRPEHEDESLRHRHESIKGM